MKLRFFGKSEKAFQYQPKIYKTDSRDIQSHAGKAKQDNCLYMRIDENPTLDVGSVLPHNASGQGQL